MIDWIKIRILALSAKLLLENPNLEFFTPVNERTGELLTNIREAKYHHLTLRVINEEYIYLTGSIHKFYHNGENLQRFSFEELIYAIIRIWEELGINPFQAKLENVEFGVNLHSPPFRVEDVIKNLLSMKGRAMTTMGKFGIGKDCYLQQYGRKIYNKGKQYKHLNPVLRWEEKVIRMQRLKRIGIVSLSDLLSWDKLNQLGGILTSSVNDFLIWDSNYHPNQLTSKNRARVKDWRNPRYWEEVRNGGGYQKYNYHRDRLREFQRDHCKPQPIWEILKTCIENEVRGVLNINPEISTVLTGFLKEIGGQNHRTFSTVLTGVADQDFNGFNPSNGKLKPIIEGGGKKTGSSEGIAPMGGGRKIRKCCMCPIEFEVKRRDQMYCSKRCRNRKSNPRHNRKRKYGTQLGRSLGLRR